MRRHFSANLGACGDVNGIKSTDAVNEHLEKGKQLLAAGQLSEAISHFHSAIGMGEIFLRKKIRQ